MVAQVPGGGEPGDAATDDNDVGVLHGREPIRVAAMRIAAFRTWVVGNPPPHFGGRYFLLVQLETDDGIVGVGEVYAATFGAHTLARMVEDVCERHVVGADPFRIEALWRDVYGRGYTGRPDISLVGVLSGIEIACWDVVGKAVGRPVYDLLGGRVRERIRGYSYLYPEAGDATDVYVDPELGREARRRIRRERLHRGQVRPGGRLHHARSAPAESRGARALGGLREGGA